MLTRNKKFLFIGIIIVLCFVFKLYAQDPEYRELNIYTGNLDATRSDVGINGQWLRLDTTNDPLTGNLEVQKADPEFKGTDTGDSNSFRLIRTAANAQMNLYNTVQKPSGVGNALRFDGANECVIIAGKPLSAIGTGNMTLAMWINPASLASLDTFYSNRSGDAAGGIGLVVGGNNNLRVVGNGGAIDFSSSNNSLSTGVWQHVSVVRSGVSGAGTINIYINGVKDGSGDANSANLSTSSSEESLACRQRISNPHRYYHGDMDDVGIWDKALSVNDLLDLVNSGNGLIIDKDTNFPTDGGSMGDNLLAVWNMDESSGTNVSDSSGNGNNGTTQNMEDADWVTGKILETGSDNEINVISAKDGLDAQQGYVIEIGDSSNPGEIIHYGDEHNWFVNGTNFMGADNNGTLTIDNGVTTAQQLILRAAPSASENIFEAQDSSGNIGFAIEEDFDIIQGSGATDKDYTLTIDGETNDGVITWMEDEDYFKSSDDILNDASEKHYFRDTAIGIYSQADTFLDLFADGAVRVGNSSAGAPTTYVEVEPDADMTFVGSGSGLPYGNMYIPASGITVIVSDNNPNEIDDASSPSWTEGQTNNTTFSDHNIAVGKAGRYLISWDLSASLSTVPAPTEIHDGIMINGTAIRNDGEGHTTVQGANVVLSVSGHTIQNLSANDEVSLWLENATNTNNIDVEHGNLTITLIGG